MLNILSIRLKKYSLGFMKRSAQGYVSHLLFAGFVVLLAACGKQEIPTSMDVETRVQEILSTMTLEQKVGQMIQAEIKFATPEDVKNYHLGSVLNGGGSFPNGKKDSTIEDWLALADRYYRASLDTSSGGAGIPIIWGTDAVHGHNNVIGATIFPHNIGLGAANDPALIRKIGEVTAREVAVTGIDWIFAPTVAVSKDYRWGRAYEAYSSESSIPKKYASEIVLGMQGDIATLPDNDDKVLATAKHFIGDGGTFMGIDQGDTQMSLDQLLEIHGQGYITALESGVQTVMASFNSWNGEKIHGHKQLLTDVLKNDWGFDGLVVSDWNGIGQVEGCTDDSCPQAINAGIDMLMVPEEWKPLLKNTLAQVKNGEIPMARIDDAVTRILRVKLRAGLDTKGLPSNRAFAGQKAHFGSEAHRAVARDAVRKSLVLLKNDNQILPLKPSQHVLIAGDGADNITKQSGGWTITWQGTENENHEFPGATSIFQGLDDVISNNGGSTELSVSGDWQKKPDVAIVVFGEDPYAEGQGDIESLIYKSGSDVDLQLLNKLRQQQIPVISVFLTGRPLWVNAEINRSDAFVVAWLPGTEGGGIADVLIADSDGRPRFDFVGRLTFNWPDAEINQQDNALPVNANLLEYGDGMSYGASPILAANLREAPAGESRAPSQIIFSGSDREPWSMLVGDSSNWRQPVAGRVFDASLGGLRVSVVDGMVQEDSRLVEWSGDHQSQFYWRSHQAVDLTEFAEQQGAITMTYRVERHPENQVIQRIDCNWPCSGGRDVTELFASAPLGEWVKSSISLSCFKQVGADLSRVNIPLLLTTSGAFSVTIKEARLNIDSEAHSISCG